MKFTEGMYFAKQGIRAISPGYVVESREEDDGLTLLVHGNRVTERGQTLMGPLFTVRLTAPMEGVIRVQMRHFKGMLPARPAFELNHDAANRPRVERDISSIRLVTGAFSATVPLDGEFSIEFRDGERLVTRTGDRAMRLVETAEDGWFAVDQLELSLGECVYGLGERFTPFVKNGQSVDIWNQDGGTASDAAYKNVPFSLSSAGYGVLVNSADRVSYEIASERVGRMQFSVPGQTLDYCVVSGPTPKEALNRYTALTGRPALPPAWSFGLWLTTSFTTDYDEGTVTSFIEGMAERDLPLSVFHFDCFWMREYRWCDFTWDDRVFPDPPAMLKRLKERGLRICAWINPYIGEQSPLFDEGAAGGCLLRRPDGSVWQSDEWQPGMAIVDFTNPAACEWFAGKLRALLNMGVDCFKTDFGERIPADVVYHNGADPGAMHNYYTYLYNRTVFELLEEERGKGEAVVFARSATAGSQRFPAHWGGDCSATYASMAESLRGGLSLLASGFAFWSHDIGGFFGTATPDLYKRWIAFGLLSSHSRLHGEGSYRVPWLFDEESVDVLRFFTNLKCRLMPYLYGKAVEAHNTGVPLMRPMFLEFPGDPTCRWLDRQYMLGDALLVAPVFSPDGSVEYYVPEGRWTHLLTGDEVVGPGWRRETHGYTSLPLLAREGAVIPMGAVEGGPDYDFADGVTLQVFPLAPDGAAEVGIPSLDGSVAAVARVRRKADSMHVSVDGGKPWKALLRGWLAVTGAVNAEWEAGPLGVSVKPSDPSSPVELRFG